MTRIVRLAGAQMGPNSLQDSRAQILARMIALLEGAAKEGAQLVVFPELAFTTFFPRWPFDDPARLTGTDEEVLAGFRRVRDEIAGKIKTWLAAGMPAR